MIVKLLNINTTGRYKFGRKCVFEERIIIRFKNEKLTRFLDEGAI